MQEFECPKCHRMLPENAVFCPFCGSLARNDMDDPAKPFGEPPVAPVVSPVNQPEPKMNDSVPEPPFPIEPQEKPQEEPQTQDTMPKESFRKRNILIAILLVVFAILFVVSNLFYGDHGKVGHEPNDSISINESNNLEELVILRRALQDVGMMSDGATAAYAVRVARNEKTNAERIVGVTSMSNSITGVAMFKIYTVVRNNGSDWAIEETPKTVNLTDHVLDFNPQSLMAEKNVVPQSATVNGKNYFFFAYKDMPVSGNDDNTRVVLALYNVDTQELRQFPFGGSVKIRDGKELVYGRLNGETSSPESRFAQAQAEKIKLIYVPTQEELEAERLAQEEAALNDPDRADDKWLHDNEETEEKLSTGAEVAVNPKTYDTPILKMGDIKGQINNELYSVMLGKNGNVYGFNKTTRQYYVIDGSGKATDIHFASDGAAEATLNIITGSGRIIYNLNTNRLRRE